MEDLHDRMPVILQKDDLPIWLDPKEDDKAKLAALFDHAWPGEQMDYHPVSRKVNSPQNDEAELLQPLN